MCDAVDRNARKPYRKPQRRAWPSLGRPRVHNGRPNGVTAERVARESEEELCAEHERRQRNIDDDARVERLLLLLHL
eukprot:6176573-Pleurochrysis_carterae.AAC.4